MCSTSFPLFEKLFFFFSCFSHILSVNTYCLIYAITPLKAPYELHFIRMVLFRARPCCKVIIVMKQWSCSPLNEFSPVTDELPGARWRAPRVLLLLVWLEVRSWQPSYFSCCFLALWKLNPQTFVMEIPSQYFEKFI